MIPKPRTIMKDGRMYSPDLLADTTHALEVWGVGARKRFSQNYILDSQVCARMVETAGVSKKDSVLEAGPGLGFLTSILADHAGKVVSVEFDESLKPILTSAMAGRQNTSVVFKDVLDVTKDDISEWFPKKYKIVANLPYAITGAFFRKFLDAKLRPQSFTVLVQKEVGGRICAESGNLSLLGLSVRVAGEPTYIETVPREMFYPSPKVDSAVIHIDCTKPGVVFDSKEEDAFWRLARIGFSSPRKTVENNLAAGFHVTKHDAGDWLQKAGINPKMRPQDISLEQWIALSRCIVGV